MKFPEKINKYLLKQELGRGAMGVVFQGLDEDLERNVAIKMLVKEYFSDPEQKTRFRQEAKIVAKLDHTNIMRIYSIENAYDTIWIIMEYLKGELLSDIIHGPVKLSTKNCSKIIESLAQALGYAHSHGIIHRDVKPTNVMIIRNHTPKLMDFGIARDQESRLNLTHTGTIMGTPKYMAPEQFSGSKVDHRVDAYSLGIMAYEIICGEPPFSGNNLMDFAYKHINTKPPPIRKKAPDISKELEHFIMSCLSKKKENRPDNLQNINFSCYEADTMMVKAPSHLKPKRKFFRLFILSLTFSFILFMSFQTTIQKYIPYSQVLYSKTDSFKHGIIQMASRKINQIRLNSLKTIDTSAATVESGLNRYMDEQETQNALTVSKEINQKPEEQVQETSYESKNIIPEPYIEKENISKSSAKDEKVELISTDLIKKDTDQKNPGNSSSKEPEIPKAAISTQIIDTEVITSPVKRNPAPETRKEKTVSEKKSEEQKKPDFIKPVIKEEIKPHLEPEIVLDKEPEVKKVEPSGLKEERKEQKKPDLIESVIKAESSPPKEPEVKKEEPSVLKEDEKVMILTPSMLEALKPRTEKKKEKEAVTDQSIQFTVIKKVPPVNQTEQNILLKLKSGDYSQIRDAARQMISDSSYEKNLMKALINVIENYLDYPLTTNIAIDAMAWCCKVIGQSANSDYLSILIRIKNMKSINNKVKSYAVNAYRLLGNKSDTGIMNDFESQLIERMKTGDYAEILKALKLLIQSERYPLAVTNQIQKIIGRYIIRSEKSNVAVDAISFCCIALEKSKNKKYVGILKSLLRSNVSKKIKTSAKKALSHIS